MPRTKKTTVEDVIAQYASSIVTITKFNKQHFMAQHESKSIHVLLADDVLQKKLYYTVSDYEKIKHNLSFLSLDMEQKILNHQNNVSNLKNGFADWFVIGTWICLLVSKMENDKIKRSMLMITYTLDLDLLHEGKLLPVPQNLLKDLKKIQEKLLKSNMENNLNQFVVKSN